MDLDLERDPPPDLAIEVEISRSAINKLAIYGDLGRGGLRFDDGDAIRIEVRQAAMNVRSSDCQFRSAGTHRRDCRGILAAQRKRRDNVGPIRS